MSDSQQRSEAPDTNPGQGASQSRPPRRRSRRRRSRSKAKSAPRGPAAEPKPVDAAPPVPDEITAEAPAAVPDEVTAEATRIEEDAATAHHDVEEQTRRQRRPSPALMELVGERLAGSEGIIVFRRPETSPCSRFRLKECFE